MTTRRRLWVLLAAALSVTAVAPPAGAQSAADTERARELYNAGAAAYGAGQYGAAVQALTEAFAIEQRVGVLFSLAQAERHLYTDKRDVGALRDAIAHYRLYLERVPQGGRRVDATDALAALEPELIRVGSAAAPAAAEPRKAATRIMVWTTTKDAVITLDGVDHTELPVVEEVKPGPHSVRARAPGYFTEERTIISVAENLVSTEILMREQPARLHVDAPPGTQVSVDGRPLGETPIPDVEVAAGTHLVGLSGAGHVAELQSVALERGKSGRVTGALRLTGQRYVAVGVLLTAAGAAVAGGVLLGVAYAYDADAKHRYDAAAAHNFGSAADLLAYQNALSDRDTCKGLSVAAFGASAGLVLVGSLLYLFDHPRPEAAPQPRVGVGAKGVWATF